MIGRIEGKIIHIDEKYVIIDTGGVGYKISTGTDTISRLAKKIGTIISLFTHMSVREDAIELYGFEKTEELSFFEHLIDISGIGPKSALGIMGMAPVSALKRAIASGDSTYMTKVSGIGKKTAEKIILELRDRFADEGHTAKDGELREELDAVEALKSLGYSQNEAREALKKVKPEQIDTKDKVKEALKILAQK